MGYDMRTVIKPEGEEVALARIAEPYNRAIETRDAIPRSERGFLTDAEMKADGWGAIPGNASARYRAAQAEVMRLADLRDRTKRSYFRLNVWGMGNVRRAMFALGMAYDSPEDREWPTWPEDVGHVVEALQDDNGKGVPEYLAEWYPEKGEPTEVELDRAKLYVAESDEIRRHHPEGGTTIPLHKFGSNDGWVVTPAECLEALAAWHGRSAGERDDALQDAKITGADWEDLWKRWLEFIELAAHCDGFEVH